MALPLASLGLTATEAEDRMIAAAQTLGPVKGSDVNGTVACEHCTCDEAGAPTERGGRRREVIVLEWAIAMEDLPFGAERE